LITNVHEWHRKNTNYFLIKRQLLIKFRKIFLFLNFLSAECCIFADIDSACRACGDAVAFHDDLQEYGLQMPLFL